MTKPHENYNQIRDTNINEIILQIKISVRIYYNFMREKSQDAMKIYLTSLTKPEIIKKDFLEEAICWLKAEENVLWELELGREERSAC